ncbi:hypothetical protein P8452_33418 [Trifolium repens]|nr:hypothetical protein P8452_33418 [Trifolium repens]
MKLEYDIKSLWKTHASDESNHFLSDYQRGEEEETLSAVTTTRKSTASMAKQIHEIKDFLLTARRKDARSVKIKRSKDVVKFKFDQPCVKFHAFREMSGRDNGKRKDSPTSFSYLDPMALYKRRNQSVDIQEPGFTFRPATFQPYAQEPGSTPLAFQPSGY